MDIISGVMSWVMSHVGDGIAVLNSLSGGNEFLAASLLLVVTGVGGYVCKDMPHVIWNFIVTQSSTTITISNSGPCNRILYESLLASVAHYIIRSMLRTSMVSFKRLNMEDYKFSLPMGRSYGYYNGKFIRFQRSRVDSTTPIEYLNITVFGRSSAVLDAIITDTIKYSARRSLDMIGVDTIIGNVTHRHEIRKTPFSNIALNPEDREWFTELTETFINNEPQYIKKNLAWKISVMLHGESGSGKTAIVKAMASECSLDITIIDISNISDELFCSAVRNVPDKSIILIEDVDCASGALVRRSEVKLSSSAREFMQRVDMPASEILAGMTPPNIVDDTPSPPQNTLTLSGMLNLLDGIIPLHGVIVIFTTNHINKLDPALLRAGRMDYIRELPPIRGEVIKPYIENLIPELRGEVIEYKPMLAKDLHDVVFRSRNDWEIARDMLTSDDDNDAEQLNRS